MNRIVYCDVDGVMADFDKGAEKVFGMPARQWEDERTEHHKADILAYEDCNPQEVDAIARDRANDDFWKMLTATPDFFLNLDPMPDAMDLWQAIKHLNPIFLTGCPEGGWAEVQKHIWVRKHFGRTANVITCKSREKSFFCQPGDVIIDDWPRHQSKWEARGGIWVHHDDAASSIKQLISLNIIRDPNWDKVHLEEGEEFCASCSGTGIMGERVTCFVCDGSGVQSV